MPHLAQLNIARFKYAPEDPGLADFMAALDPINALADSSPGFVWRLQDESGNATGINAFDDPMTLVNMSVWEDVDSLYEFVYRSPHIGIMRRRAEWTQRMEEAHMVLWWIPEDHIPTLDEAKGKLDLLRGTGPTPEAFTFRDRFPPQTRSS
jgi:hypothetical protein